MVYVSNKVLLNSKADACIIPTQRYQLLSGVQHNMEQCTQLNHANKPDRESLRGTVTVAG